MGVLGRIAAAAACDGEYGLVANVIGADKSFRVGGKVWLLYWYGDGRGEWYGISHGGRRVRKVAPTKKFTDFRAAWIPDHMQDRISFRGTRTYIDAAAERIRRTSPNNRASAPPSPVQRHEPS